MSAVCDADSQFERSALVETVRRRSGTGSIAVTLTTPALSATVTYSPRYVIYAVIYPCSAV